MAGATFVVSDRGDILSPKKAPEAIAPAVMKVGRTVQSRAQGTKKFLVPLVDAGQGRSGYAEGMPSQLGHRQPRGSQLFVEAPLDVPVPEEAGVSQPAPQLDPEVNVPGGTRRA